MEGRGVGDRGNGREVVEGRGVVEGREEVEGKGIGRVRR